MQRDLSAVFATCNGANDILLDLLDDQIADLQREIGKMRCCRSMMELIMFRTLQDEYEEMRIWRDKVAAGCD